MISSSIKKSEIQGVEIRVEGIVQGVGFRPFIYNLAAQLQISGTVSNTSAGVFIEAFGSKPDLDRFIAEIGTDAPPLAVIFSIATGEIEPRPLDTVGFTILTSSNDSTSTAAIPPDIATCNDCLEELFSPTDRRFHYPFINCTNCGPRFTIVENIPYDRPATSMKVFPMCEECNNEYHTPSNRRFHAQPNACPRCGPQISWHTADGKKADTADPVAAAIAALKDDKIVAIRGLGGFHLVVDASSEKAVEQLRRRKNRPTKPLAIMVAGLTVAESFCHISLQEREKLLSPQHPIVLLRKKNNTDLAGNLCPGVDDIGIMLPYTPLHHLLFANGPLALVMTSGNSSGRPICITNKAALAELGKIADFFLFHNREIVTRVDDSVTKYMQGDFRLFRRARGFSPAPLVLGVELPQILGCGGGLKSTFCLGRKNLAYLSQHIGDLFNLESYDFYTESIDHHRKVFEITPEIAVCDLHPDYMSSHYADQLDLPVYRVQHHHAHAAAVMAEHNLTGPVLAIILDGTGYGPDHTIWGGEFLRCTLTDFTRLAHLEYLPLPGGDIAAREPWRMAFAALYKPHGIEGIGEDLLPPPLQAIDPQKRAVLAQMLQSNLNTPLTSSCGRLFDAMAALLGIRLFSDYEGHAAMELEAIACKSLKYNWKNDIDLFSNRCMSLFSLSQEGKWEINSTKFVMLAMEKIAMGMQPSRIAYEFHLELICTVAELVQQLSRQHSLQQIVLSGGCLQNRLLLEGIFYVLEKIGLQVFTGVKVPINDGGISFGQIIIGGLQHVSRHSHAGN